MTIKKERKTGLEPATSTLGRLRSTNCAIFAYLLRCKGTNYFLNRSLFCLKSYFSLAHYFA